MAYIHPSMVISPKASVSDLEVIYNDGEGSWSAATMTWNGKPGALGIRWNGEDGSVGSPQSRGIPMRVEHSEPAKTDPNCEFRLGVASWEDGSDTAKSIKYKWFDKNGQAARGGEFPVEALPQALDLAIRHGYVSLCT